MEVTLTITGEQIEVSPQEYANLRANNMVRDEQASGSIPGRPIPAGAAQTVPVATRGQDGTSDATSRQTEEGHS